MTPSPAPTGPDLREIIAEVFADALERMPADRVAFLNVACRGRPELRREVESLLSAHEGCADFLEPSQSSRLAPIPAAPEERSHAGERIGCWRLVRSIGHGGTGTVYLGERADGQFNQQVAIKLVRDGVGSRLLAGRFLRERHILARLDHPNIARLLDAGATGTGRPYLVMEYIEGEPLTTWCEQRGLGIDARLRLFLDVCAAVQYAHGRLVVHRDLKPANIIVSMTGRVKLLDFGIAKLLEPQNGTGANTLTEIGFRAMTPEYAAPEQVRGEPLTTATDVYGLGAVLYELLCGRRPRDFGARTLEEIVRTLGEPPRPPSAVVSSRALRQRLSGDLDAIVLTALRPEPELRYASADALCEDVRKHLVGLPVSARRGSALYHLRRFVRRNRVAVAAGILALSSLAAGLAGTTWQARQAARERDLARSEADKAARVSEFMGRLFHLAHPYKASGNDVTLREALDSGRVWVGREFTGQPELRAEMEVELGEVYYGLGLYEDARRLLSPALATRIELYGDLHADVLDVTLRLARVMQDLGYSDSAEVLARRSLAVLNLQRGKPDSDFLATHVLDRLANTRRLQGDLDEADSLARRALATLPQAHPEAPNRRTVILTTLGHIEQARGRAVEAESLYREVLERRRVLWGTEHPEVANALVNLGLALGEQGRFAEAEASLEQGLAMRRKLQGESHPEVGNDLGHLANTLRMKGDAVAAAERYREALGLLRRLLSADHPVLARTLFGYGLTLLDLGRAREAETVLLEALEIRRQVPGHALPDVNEVQSALTLASQKTPSGRQP